MKHVVNFSGGICSFWAAHRVIAKHGPQDVTLLFADTLMEDWDLYRFLDEAGAVLGVPVTRCAEGRSVWEVFEAESPNMKIYIASHDQRGHRSEADVCQVRQDHAVHVRARGLR